MKVMLIVILGFFILGIVWLVVEFFQAIHLEDENES